MNAPTFSSAGVKAASNTTLSKDIFAVDVKNHELLRSAYDAYLANGRINLAVVKTRGLVRGGGKKPWRQKGTGRARFGSSRNPIWRGGGIVFGPTGQENYTKSLNVKAKRLALRQALTVSNAKIRIIEDIKLKTPKTSELAKLINKLKLDGYSLVVVDQISKELALAHRNIPELKVIKASNLNVYDTLNADNILITKAALKELDNRLGDK